MHVCTGAVCLIDDSQTYAAQCAEAGIPCVLFGEYAWNSSATQAGGAQWVKAPATAGHSHLVRKAADWSSARQHLKDLVQEAVAAAAAGTSATTTTISSSSSSGSYGVAVVQLNSGSDKEANLAKISAFVAAAAADAAITLVALPECCTFMGTSPAHTVQAAEAMDMSGGSLAVLCALAVQHSVWLSVGGLAVPAEAEAEVGGEPGRQAKVYNRHVMIDPHGQVQMHYDKIHLFDNPLTGMQESSYVVYVYVYVCVYCECVCVRPSLTLTPPRPLSPLSMLQLHQAWQRAREPGPGPRAAIHLWLDIVL